MATKIDKVTVRQGRIVRVKNMEKRSNLENPDYNAIWVESADGGDERCLLFTDYELERAETRALRNPEDLPAKPWWVDVQD